MDTTAHTTAARASAAARVAAAELFAAGVEQFLDASTEMEKSQNRLEKSRTSRNEGLVKMRASGAQVKEIAEVTGLSVSRVRDITGETTSDTEGGDAPETGERSDT